MSAGVDIALTLRHNSPRTSRRSRSGSCEPLETRSERPRFGEVRLTETLRMFLNSRRRRASDRHSRVPILMYHEVAPKADPRFQKYVVSPRSFALQMAWLRTAGYTPITLDVPSGQPWWRGTAASSPPVVITFDDGFADCANYAADVLERHRSPAAFFLVAGLIGQTSKWLLRERGIELRLADWTQVRRLQTSGFECGAHSLTHPRLATLANAECRNELAEGRRILEDGLGQRSDSRRVSIRIVRRARAYTGG